MRITGTNQIEGADKNDCAEADTISIDDNIGIRDRK
jgi:hypothetical protein